MKAATICFSAKGFKLAKKLKIEFPEIKIYKCEAGMLTAWTKENFFTNELLIFIGSVGIAVRAVSKFITKKNLDPAVLVIDDNAKFVIPILSGHIGGANYYAKKFAVYLNSTPVITTATDINNVFAIDVWATKNNFVIDNIEKIKNISAKLLNNEKVFIKSDFEILNNLPKNIFKSKNNNFDVVITFKKKENYNALKIIVPCLCLGVGCKKNTSSKKIINAFKNFINENNLHKKAFINISSIDLKKNEQAIKDLAKFMQVNFKTYSVQELNSVKNKNFSSSEFVLKTVGVDNVCERSAMINYDELLISKTKMDGITFAVSLKKINLKF